MAEVVETSLPWDLVAPYKTALVALEEAGRMAATREAVEAAPADIQEAVGTEDPVVILEPPVPAVVAVAAVEAAPAMARKAAVAAELVCWAKEAAVLEEVLEVLAKADLAAEVSLRFPAGPAAEPSMEAGLREMGLIRNMGP